MDKSDAGIAVKKILAGISAAFLLTASGVLLNGLLLMLTPLKIESSPLVIMGFITVSAVILGFFVSSAIGKKGFVTGALSGFFFIAAVNILIGLVLGYPDVVSVRSVLFVIPAAGAAVGGIAGVGKK